MKSGYVIRSDSRNILYNQKFLGFVYQAIAWIIAANFFIVIKAWGIEDTTGYLVFKKENMLLVHLEASMMGFFMGIVLAYIDLQRIRFFGRKKPFGITILIKAFSYLASLIIIISIVAFIFLLIFGASIPEAISRLTNFISSTYYLTIIIYGAFVSFLISFIKQVDSKFGQGNLLNMLIGRYHRPRVEDRIFLFIDMKSSTEYAEKLGHIKYSRLIQDCFYDITSLVKVFKGEIYQYVGDEIVISWKTRDGLENYNCLNLFYKFMDLIERRTPYYKKEYGMVPAFKAGMNGGHITVAEVGILKRDIAYHGDTINTAARIQAQCNKYDERLLISGQLYYRLNNCQDYDIQRIDKVSLKGKRKPVEIFTVNTID